MTLSEVTASEDSLTDISTGEAFVLARTASGSVFFFGLLRDDNGKIFSFGDKSVGAVDKYPVHIPLQLPAKQIWTAKNACFALLSNDELVSWGKWHALRI